MPEMEPFSEGQVRPADLAHRLYPAKPPPGGEYRRRVNILTGVLLGVLVLLWLRLIQLQLLEGGEYRRRCDSLIRKTIPLPAHRGAIRARDGRILAIDEPAFDIAIAYPAMVNDERWIRRQQRLHRISRDEVLRRVRAAWGGLARLSASSEDELRATAGRIIARVQLIKDAVSAAAGRPILVREERIAHPVLRDVDLALVEQVLLHRLDWLGVEVQVRTRRRYPWGATACHLIGYMLRVRDWQLRAWGTAYRGDRRRAYQVGELVGSAGVEAARNFELRGRRGWAQVIVDARGHIQRTLERVEPEPGQDVFLSIDLDLQQAVEHALSETCQAMDTTGAAVVLDVHTGEVLAMASYPFFDPGRVRRDYSRLARDPAQPLLNRAIAAHYPPGSVFKVVDSVAALEGGTITPETRFACHHRFLVGRRYFHCEGNHGEIDFTTALAKSCNIYFYQLALRVGQPAILAWAYRFGFGRRTGIELPGEVPGILPPANKHRGSTCNLAIGQGRLAVTPLQVALMMAEVANGGRRLRPTVFRVSGGAMRRGEGGALGISPTTLAALRRALREVVVSGTARRVGFDAVVSVAGKTGTAQVAGGKKPHAWFAGYAPADAPRIAFAVLIEHGGHGGEAAAPVARDFLAQHFRTPRTADSGPAVSGVLTGSAPVH